MAAGEQVYIGVDAGGSKTELVARSSKPAEDVRLNGSGANPQRVGVEEAARRLASLVRQAVDHFSREASVAVCAGVAGAGRMDDRNALNGRLRRELGPRRVEHIRIVHDAAIALEAAFENASGVVVIAGTGSVVFARTTAGAVERVGGWGYLLGDEGSGHAIGRDGLRAVAHAIDGGPSTRLRALLADRYDLASRDELIHRVYGESWAVQEAAPLVIEAAAAGDAVAQDIVAEQADKLAQQVEWLAARRASITPRVALTGGLIREDHYADALSRALKRRLPDWGLTTPMHPPVIGALRLACRAFAEDDEAPA